MSQFTTHIPPPILFGTPVKSTTTTRPAHGLTPSSVRSWIGFVDQVRHHIWDENIRLDHDAWFIDSGIVYNKADVKYFFNCNILNSVEYCIQCAIPEKQLKILRERQIPESGIPDYSFTENGHPRFFIELKTPWNISGDLVEQYNSEEENLCITHAIRQVFGYMGDAKLRYSVLSTTWFMFRPFKHPGTLLISNCIQRTSPGPTLLRCFLSMVLLSGDGNHFTPTPPQSTLPPLPPQSDSEPLKIDYDEDPTYNPSGTRNQGKGKIRTGCRGSATNIEQFNWGEFNITNKLGGGRCGTVYEAIFRGDSVAVKIGDAWKFPGIEDEMINEAKTYMHLEKLQGITIPKLKGFGYTGGGLLAPATEISGSLVRIENLCDEERYEVIKALSSLHDLGVLHGDIRPSNILVQYQCGKANVKLIDLGFSRKSLNKKEARIEMNILKRMLGLEMGGKKRV